MTTSPSLTEDRFTSWVCQHARAVRGYLRALIWNETEVDDLAQEVFRRAWAARDRYQERGAARAYLLRIADRLACDRARRERRERNVDSQTWEAIEPAAEIDDPAETLGKSEAQRQLAAALDRLSSPQRRVLLLRYYGQMTFADIAATIPCPLGTALSHCRRGLLALREMLAEIPP